MFLNTFFAQMSNFNSISGKNDFYVRSTVHSLIKLNATVTFWLLVGTARLTTKRYKVSQYESSIIP
jgi:hypothetical protein